MPFGGGVRRCLGASFALFEMRQVLATVLAGVDLQPPRAERAVARRGITLAPAGAATAIVSDRRAAAAPVAPALVA